MTLRILLLILITGCTSTSVQEEVVWNDRCFINDQEKYRHYARILGVLP